MKFRSPSRTGTSAVDVYARLVIMTSLARNPYTYVVSIDITNISRFVYDFYEGTHFFSKPHCHFMAMFQKANGPCLILRGFNLRVDLCLSHPHQLAWGQMRGTLL